MTINEYQVLALRTKNTELNEKEQLMNGLLGLAGETGEICDLVKKHKYQKHNFSRDKAIHELGDICWYVALTAEALGYTLEEVMTLNIEKLEMRYRENKFSADSSINRII